MSANTTVRITADAATPRGSLGWELGLPLLRIAFVGVACVLAWLILDAATGGAPFPAPAFVVGVAMLPVNLACLWLVVRRIRVEGGSVRAMVGRRPGRLGRDILWGLLWLVVLSVPFLLAVVGTTFLLHGVSAESFTSVFGGPAAMPAMPPWVVLLLAVVGVLTFAPLNAPAEELVYRGYAQDGLARRMPAAASIIVVAVLFGLQHAFFAPTLQGVVVFVVAFTVWGLGAGIIARLQGRLLPLIIAHFLVNLSLSLPSLALPFFLDGAS